MTDESASQPPPKVVKVFGKTGSPQCYAIRDFLYRNDVPFEWIELRTDEDVRAAGLLSASDDRLPICVFADGTRMERPAIQHISEKLGWLHDPWRSAGRRAAVRRSKTILDFPRGSAAQSSQRGRASKRASLAPRS